MPQKKSAKKRLKQTSKRNARNRGIRSRMATAVRGAREASPEERDAALKRAVSAIDKAAKAGAIKRETADRKKSKLVRDLTQSS